METMQGKHFSITDPDGVKTVIYQVNKTKKEYLNQYPKYTVERLDHTEEIVGNYNKKTFYVDEPQKDGNQLIILSFAKIRWLLIMVFCLEMKLKLLKNLHLLNLIHYTLNKKRNIKTFNIHQNFKKTYIYYRSRNYRRGKACTLF